MESPREENLSTKSKSAEFMLSPKCSSSEAPVFMYLAYDIRMYVCTYLLCIYFVCSYVRMCKFIPCTCMREVYVRLNIVGYRIRNTLKLVLYD